MSKPRVAILGGGIAGMSAAHELAERGFAVDVYERRRVPGGKARSFPTDDPAALQRLSVPRTHDYRPALPGEHGFRFFPGFYKHVIDTMARIPIAAGKSVADNLIDTTHVHVARFRRPAFFYPARFPQTAGEILSAIRGALGFLAGELDISPDELGFFTEKIFQILTSCRERRLAEYEHIDWWDFIDAEQHSKAYQEFFGQGFTRSLVAAKADYASTKTVGDIFIQMVLSAVTPGITADRVLNGPTNDAWINPWIRHLERLGVNYHHDCEVLSLEFQRGLVRSAKIARGERVCEVTADYFLGALPVERMAELITPEMKIADQSLTNLDELATKVEWMNGLQFYLKRDQPLVYGHTVYLDSPWALTSVSQAQFWPDYPLSGYGDGSVKGILSVCVSDWKWPGLNGKKADECTRQEIMEEVWRELKLSLNGGGEQVLRDQDLHSWFMDPAIEDTDPVVPGPETNAEPLLVNYKYTWQLRPEASLAGIRNLFLASDYVRTNTDIATMEAANEAARRAVNGILAATRSQADPCRLWELEEPAVFAPLVAHDQARFNAQEPWDPALTSVAHQALLTAEQLRSVLHPASTASEVNSENSPAAPIIRILSGS